MESSQNHMSDKATNQELAAWPILQHALLALLHDRLFVQVE